MNIEPVVRDWTQETLVIDLVNSIGEKYHFEIEPDEKDTLPTRPSTSPGVQAPHGVFVMLHFPL